MGSDESHFNVSLTVRGRVTRQCPETTTFQEKGEPKRIRTEVPLLTIPTPYRKAKSAHIKTIIGGSCHKYYFVATKLLSRQTRVCRDQTRLLSRQNYACRDKSFAATKLCLSLQNIFVATKRLSRQIFAATNIINKPVFVATKYHWRESPQVSIVATSLILSRHGKHTFVATKHVFVATILLSGQK